MAGRDAPPAPHTLSENWSLTLFSLRPLISVVWLPLPLCLLSAVGAGAGGGGGQRQPQPEGSVAGGVCLVPGTHGVLAPSGHLVGWSVWWEGWEGGMAPSTFLLNAEPHRGEAL